MVNWEAIEIELLPQERKLLLLQYGYPFDDLQKQLHAFDASTDIEIITISRFYLNQLIGNVSYSINKRTKGRIQSDLFDLCDRLEFAERQGESMLDFW